MFVDCIVLFSMFLDACGRILRIAEYFKSWPTGGSAWLKIISSTEKKKKKHSETEMKREVL